MASTVQCGSCGATIRDGQSIVCEWCGASLQVASQPTASAASAWDQAIADWRRFDEDTRRLQSALNTLGAVGCGLIAFGLLLPVVAILLIVAWPVVLPLGLLALIGVGLFSGRKKQG